MSIHWQSMSCRYRSQQPTVMPWSPKLAHSYRLETPGWEKDWFILWWFNESIKKLKDGQKFNLYLCHYYHLYTSSRCSVLVLLTNENRLCGSTPKRQTHPPDSPCPPDRNWLCVPRPLWSRWRSADRSGWRCPCCGSDCREHRGRC